MNLKTKVAILAAAAAGSALATVTTQNTLCRIAVDSGAKSTIVALPLKNVGGAEAQILVTNLVMTTGLANKDKLLYWNANKGTGDWDAWEVSNNAWVPVESTGGSTPAADTANLPCGSAVWIECNEPKTIYLFGQYFSSGASTTVVAGKSTMVGPCATTDVPVNSLKAKKTEGSFVEGDKIQIVDASNTRLGIAEYVWRGTNDDGQFKKLGIENGAVVWNNLADTVVIPAGQGFWYVSKGGDPTFTWVE